MGVKSDFNQNGVRAGVVAKPVLFADMPLSFTTHPVYDDIKPITDIDAIRQSVKNLVLTDFFEVPFNPSIGSNLSSLLFENADVFTARSIQDEIVRVLEKYEPRIGKIKVTAKDEPDRNAYFVTIEFLVIGIDQTITVDFYLFRNR